MSVCCVKNWSTCVSPHPQYASASSHGRVCGAPCRVRGWRWPGARQGTCMTLMMWRDETRQAFASIFLPFVPSLSWQMIVCHPEKSKHAVCIVGKIPSVVWSGAPVVGVGLQTAQQQKQSADRETDRANQHTAMPGRERDRTDQHTAQSYPVRRKGEEEACIIDPWRTWTTNQPPFAPLRENGTFFGVFPYVCPEPVLVK